MNDIIMGGGSFIILVIRWSNQDV